MVNEPRVEERPQVVVQRILALEDGVHEGRREIGTLHVLQLVDSRRTRGSGREQFANLHRRNRTQGVVRQISVACDGAMHDRGEHAGPSRIESRVAVEQLQDSAHLIVPDDVVDEAHRCAAGVRRQIVAAGGVDLDSVFAVVADGTTLDDALTVRQRIRGAADEGARSARKGLLPRSADHARLHVVACRHVPASRHADLIAAARAREAERVSIPDRDTLETRPVTRVIARSSPSASPPCGRPGLQNRCRRSRRRSARGARGCWERSPRRASSRPPAPPRTSRGAPR